MHMTVDDAQLERAATFWVRKDADERQMDSDDVRSQVDEFLSQRKICALATGGGDSIRCTPLEYDWRDGALWIFSEGGLKFRGLRESGRVSVAVFDANGSFGKLRSAQIQGTAQIVDPSSSEYEAEAQARRIPLQTLRDVPEPMWLIKIVPTEITLLNSGFKEKGFGIRQTWRP
jgi:nitroimidazol reductase NimA-like FMN-containing flavoprotein (pyridoxamine 5'-phosphate oxidase superfamily)